jgi:alpha-ribazole phosphatase
MNTNYIDLLRHGKTTAGSAYIGSSDVALVELGWSQMQTSVDDAIATGTRWDIIVTSSLQRCRSFATQLATTLGVPIEVNLDIVEYDFGDWEQKTALEVMALYPEKLELFWSDPLKFPPANAENLTDFSHRIDRAIAKIQDDYAGKHILLVTHGGVIRYLLSRAQHLPINEMLNFAVGHGEIVRIDL